MNINLIFISLVTVAMEKRSLHHGVYRTDKKISTGSPLHVATVARNVINGFYGF